MTRDFDDLSDGDLIARTRDGDSAAYGVLWKRHWHAARAMAASVTGRFEPDDLASEAFARILRSIERGSGPRSGFRAYLATTVRNVAIDWSRRKSVPNIEDADVVEDWTYSELTALEHIENETVARAFYQLPDSWQEVLWYTEVEDMAPRDVAPLLGLTPNAVSALAVRAREGLRQSWITAHLAEASHEDPAHAWTIKKLGQYVRGKLSASDRRRVVEHLERCAPCSDAAGEADHVGSRIALGILPLFLGLSGAVAYSAWVSGRSGAALAATLPTNPLAARQAGRVRQLLHTVHGASTPGAAAGIAAGVITAAALVTGVLTSTSRADLPSAYAEGAAAGAPAAGTGPAQSPGPAETPGEEPAPGDPDVSTEPPSGFDASGTLPADPAALHPGEAGPIGENSQPEPPAPTPTPQRTPLPTPGPSASPTSGPTPLPTVSPTPQPTPSPSLSPTPQPTPGPSAPPKPTGDSSVPPCSPARCQAAIMSAASADPLLAYRLDDAAGATHATSIVTNATASYDGPRSAAGWSLVDDALRRPADEFTVQIWFLARQGGGRLIGFSSEAHGLSRDYDRHLFLTDDGHVTFGVFPDSVHTLTSPRSYADARWHQATATLSRDGMTLYVDGEQVALDPSVTRAQRFAGHWRIGFDNLDNWGPETPTRRVVDGELAYAAVYAAALTPEQVLTQWQLSVGWDAS